MAPENVSVQIMDGAIRLLTSDAVDFPDPEHRGMKCAPASPAPRAGVASTRQGATVSSHPEGETVNTFVAGENIGRFADQLYGAVDVAKRATLLRLLVEEEDKLGVGLEQLGVIELRIAKGHQLIADQRTLVTRMEADGRDGHGAQDLLTAMIAVQAAFERRRRWIVENLNHRTL
jgi:hypothetical protein